IEFAKETLALLPFLFVTYLVLEAVEAHAGGALERGLERTRAVGPLVGALAGAIPQCGVSAAAASLYAGGVVSVGTLLAVFLSTSDELVPVLISKQVPVALMVKIVALKAAAGIISGFSVDAVLRFARHVRRPVEVHDLCAHSLCGCSRRKGILVPALIHTAEIFLFIVVVSGSIELAMHFFGEDCLQALRLNSPVFGELAAGLLGLVPNCAVSVAGAELYCKGAMSAGALMASSFTGAGVGLIVLFRTNRNLKENLFILAGLYAMGVVLGWLAGFLL
ncbi:MAG: arsenic efflux protein, partial [Kiritimatiellae bacterium]|nr:arsenic efflux protein [Kiritimatiellia bacterium]